MKYKILGKEKSMPTLRPSPHEFCFVDFPVRTHQIRCQRPIKLASFQGNEVVNPTLVSSMVNTRRQHYVLSAAVGPPLQIASGLANPRVLGTQPICLGAYSISWKSRRPTPLMARSLSYRSRHSWSSQHSSYRQQHQQRSPSNEREMEEFAKAHPELFEEFRR